MKIKITNSLTISLFLAFFYFVMPNNATASDSNKKVYYRVLKLNNYNSQDAVRDSFRYALYEVNNSNLNFWEREYPVNAGFSDRAALNDVQVFKDRPALHYKLWMQDGRSPLVFILPGVGGHYQSPGLNAMAQTFYNAGYSVSVISSTMNWEFYLAACSSKVPGFSPFDATDIRHALRIILQDIRTRYPNRISGVYLVGYSLGGAHVLFVAEQESKAKQKLGIKGYLAIHPPVNAFGAIMKIDKFIDTWKKWPKDQVMLNIEKVAAAYMALASHKVPANSHLNVPKENAAVLISLAYKYALRELLLAVRESNNDMGMIKAEYGFTKNDLYKELDKINFNQYTRKFVTKSVQLRLKKNYKFEKLMSLANLRSIQPFLQDKASNVRVITSLDDFIMDEHDIRWLASVFGERVLFFNHGGHLGELYTEQAQKAMINSLSDASTTLKK